MCVVSIFLKRTFWSLVLSFSPSLSFRQAASKSIFGSVDVHCADGTRRGSKPLIPETRLLLGGVIYSVPWLFISSLSLWFITELSCLPIAPSASCIRFKGLVLSLRPLRRLPKTRIGLWVSLVSFLVTWKRFSAHRSRTAAVRYCFRIISGLR